MWRSNWRLRADVARWRKAGWVTEAGEAAICAELSERRSVSAGTSLVLLGAALVSFAAMSFVAANWEGIPRLARLLLLITAMGGAYLAAAELFVRQMPAFGHAALVTGAGLFGANVMLVAQMYHIDGNPPDAVLLWAAGALATAMAGRSKPVLFLALALVCLWGAWETVQSIGIGTWNGQSSIFWPFLLGWAAVTAAIAQQRWRYGLHLAAVSLAIFIVSSGYLAGRPMHVAVFLVGLGIVGIGVLVSTFRSDLPPWARDADAVIPYGLGIAGAGLYAAQFVDERSTLGFAVWALIGLALAAGATAFGNQTGRRAVTWLGVAGFVVEAFTIYFRTIGTLLGSAGFFLVTGALLIGLAVFVLSVERRSNPRVGG